MKKSPPSKHANKMEEKKTTTAANGKLPYEKAEMEIIDIDYCSMRLSEPCVNDCMPDCNPEQE